MMVRVQFGAGAEGPAHTHPHRQVSYVEKGSLRVHIGGEERTLRPGDSFIVPPGVPHGVLAFEEGVLVDIFAPAREDFLKSREGATPSR
jgi:quercetin dioxygenase-like cupin family protein